MNWKKFIKERFFLSCLGIRDWHVVKINQDDESNILVTNYINEPLRIVKVIDTLPLSIADPEVIIPDSIPDSWMKDLELFNDYVIEEHKSFISY